MHHGNISHRSVGLSLHFGAVCGLYFRPLTFSEEHVVTESFQQVRPLLHIFCVSVRRLRVSFEMQQLEHYTEITCSGTTLCLPVTSRVLCLFSTFRRFEAHAICRERVKH